MICYYCHWGWPREIAEIYIKAARLLNGDTDLLEYGPAHIVWCDENFDDDAVNWCLYKDTLAYDLTKKQEGIIIQSLRDLLEVNHTKRQWPDYFDVDDDPSKYPPPSDWDCVSHYWIEQEIHK